MSDLIAEKFFIDNEDTGVEEVPENPKRHPNGEKVKEENRDKINLGDIDRCGNYEFL